MIATNRTNREPHTTTQAIVITSTTQTMTMIPTIEVVNTKIEALLNKFSQILRHKACKQLYLFTNGKLWVLTTFLEPFNIHLRNFASGKSHMLYKHR